LDLGQLELIVFDFDGTLAELKLDFPDMRRQVARLAASFGLDLEATGQPYLLEAVAELTATGGRQGKNFAEQAEELIARIENKAAGQSRLFDGVKPGLARLRKLGLRLAIITRNSRLAVEKIFPDVASWCHLFLPREEAPKPKPSPEHLTKALESLNVPPDKSLMVGDHPLDVATARAVGAWACGLTTGRMSAQDLAGADLVLGSLEELVAALEEAQSGDTDQKV